MILVFATGENEPPRHLRPQARRPRGHPRRIQADRHDRPWPLGGPAPAPASGQSRWTGAPPSRADDARPDEPPQRDPPPAHRPQPASAFFDKIASRDDFPMLRLGPRQPFVHTTIRLARPQRRHSSPTFLMEGPLVWPGQHAGFLGPKHDPWHIKQDPSRPDFREEKPLAAGRLHRRALDRRRMPPSTQLAVCPTGHPPRLDLRRFFRAAGGSALSLHVSGKDSRAFELAGEDPRVRDRYGRHMFGQSLLLARRLVQAGVPIVQVNLGRGAELGHALGQLQEPQGQAPPADRSGRLPRCWLTSTRMACSTRRWSSSRASSAGRPGSASARLTPMARTAAITGPPASRRPSPAQASAAAR